MSLKLIKKKQCSVVDCDLYRDDGDNLFCKRHRLDWIETCDRTFGMETEAEEVDILNLLKNFQDKVYNDGG